MESLSFENILPIWRDQLWPGRSSPIEPVSAIDFDGGINLDILQARPYFWGQREGPELIAVSSGFLTSATHFRLRGTWVHETHRRRHWGRRLIEHGVKTARAQGAEILWTMPRWNAWDFYQSLGFQKSKEAVGFEFGPHWIATIQL